MKLKAVYHINLSKTVKVFKSVHDGCSRGQHWVQIMYHPWDKQPATWGRLITLDCFYYGRGSTVFLLEWKLIVHTHLPSLCTHLCQTCHTQTCTVPYPWSWYATQHCFWSRNSLLIKCDNGPRLMEFTGLMSWLDRTVEQPLKTQLYCQLGGNTFQVWNKVLLEAVCALNLHLKHSAIFATARIHRSRNQRVEMGVTSFTITPSDSLENFFSSCPQNLVLCQPNS